jgi:hypothetical protein
MAFNVASIASSAVLVTLTISVWTGRKIDKKVSAEIDADHSTQVRAGNYNKALMAGAQELEAVNKYTGASRIWHGQQTLPWSDGGERVVPVARLFDYKPELAARGREFDHLVNEFLGAYDTLVQGAQFRLGSLFNADEYPPRDVVASKFGFRYVFSPLPTSGDFRVDIGNEGLEELKREFDTNQDRYIQQAMLDVWLRVKDVAERLSNQLRVETTGEVERLGKHVFPVERKGKLYQSTLDGALELCEMLRSMNLTNDPELEQVRKNLQMTLQGVDLKELKKDTAVRLSVKSEIDDLISKFNF